MICEGCAANPRTHSLRCVGLDKARRPVLYHCFSQADARFNATHNNQHLMRILDDCCRVMDGTHPPPPLVPPSMWRRCDGWGV